MDYEKLYKEALKRARECLKDGTITNVAIGYIEEIFPELADSEDERIREEIIEFVEFVADSRSNKEEWLAWLKKRTKL